MIRFAALFLMASLALGQEAQPRPLVIRVTRDEWGKASAEEVKRVLESAGESLRIYISSRTIPAIEVSRTDMDPITFFERGPGGEIRMRLNVSGMHWAQFAFQFGHELAHVLSGNLEYSNPNLWFEETLCEVASLFVLGRLAESWKTNPPYPNWKEYSDSLASYRRERLESAKIPGGASLPEWFVQNEGSLRKDPHQRALNLAMAKLLLPLFESEPARWEAIGALNAVREDPHRAFRQYLRDWRSSADKTHRPFILAIAERFGVSLDP